MNTQVVIAYKSHPTSQRNTIPAYAMAALPLVSPAPIQDINLLDYALTYKSVNSASDGENNTVCGLTDSVGDTFIIDTNILTMIFDVTDVNPIINNAFPGLP